MPDVLTPSEVAELFSVTPTTVSQWADKGQIRGFKTLGGHWRFHRADIEPLVAMAAPKPKAAS